MPHHRWEADHSAQQEIEREDEEAEPNGRDVCDAEGPGTRRLGRVVTMRAEELVVFHQHPDPEETPGDDEQGEGSLDEDGHRERNHRRFGLRLCPAGEAALDSSSGNLRTVQMISLDPLWRISPD